MMKCLSRTRYGLAAAALVVAVLISAGCSTPQALPVDCSGRLRPINAVPAVASPAGTTPDGLEHGV